MTPGWPHLHPAPLPDAGIAAGAGLRLPGRVRVQGRCSAGGVGHACGHVVRETRRIQQWRPSRQLPAQTCHNSGARDARWNLHCLGAARAAGHSLSTAVADESQLSVLNRQCAWTGPARTLWRRAHKEQMAMLRTTQNWALPPRPRCRWWNGHAFVPS